MLKVNHLIVGASIIKLKQELKNCLHLVFAFPIRFDIPLENMKFIFKDMKL